jgi:hypothetical protein
LPFQILKKFVLVVGFEIFAQVMTAALEKSLKTIEGWSEAVREYEKLYELSGFDKEPGRGAVRIASSQPRPIPTKAGSTHSRANSVSSQVSDETTGAVARTLDSIKTLVVQHIQGSPKVNLNKPQFSSRKAKEALEARKSACKSFLDTVDDYEILSRSVNLNMGESITWSRNIYLLCELE